MLLLQIKTFVNENSPFENFSNPHTYLSYNNIYRTFILPPNSIFFPQWFLQIVSMMFSIRNEPNKIPSRCFTSNNINYKWILNEFNLSNKQLLKKWFSKMSRFIYVIHSIFVWMNLRLNLYTWIMCMFMYVHYFFSLCLCEGEKLLVCLVWPEAAVVGPQRWREFTTNGLQDKFTYLLYCRCQMCDSFKMNVTLWQKQNEGF